MRLPLIRSGAFVLTVFLGLLVCVGVGSARAAQGDALPMISLPDVDTGSPTDVAAALKGSVGALVYMQTSCAACRKEILALKDIQAKNAAFKILVVSVDSGSPERVKTYKEHFGFSFPFLHDPEFKTPEFFGFSFTPALVLVGKDGKIALLKGGYRPGDEVELEKRISELSAK